MTTEAYVWQAAGRQEVADAVKRSQGFMDTHHFRAAELRWTGTSFAIERVVSTSLPTAGCGLVVRVGASAASLEWTKDQRSELEKVVSELAALRPKEIQCDYDCPQRGLETYRKLLKHLRAAADPVTVVPTALPSWLDEPAFTAFAKDSPGYVLQIHSLGLPSSPEDPLVLMDPEQARKAVAKASRIGVPFRVAMATYGCEVWFDSSGKVIEVISEDRPPEGRVPARRAYGYADPQASAELISEWNLRRPNGLAGVIWYRLPMKGDRRNWPMGTLEAVIRGESPVPSIQIERITNGGAGDVALFNRGTAPGRLPGKLTARGPVAALDAVGAYRLGSGDERTTFLLRDDVWPWLDPGCKIVIGWVTSRDAGESIEFDKP